MASMARVRTFIENATAVQLKEKLNSLGLATAGLKTALKLRLDDAVRSLGEQEPEELFPANFLLSAISETEEVSGIGGADDGPAETDEDLDAELEALRQKLEKKRKIAELKKQISELEAAEETTAIPRLSSNFNFRDVEESFASFSGDDNYRIEMWLQNFEESADVLNWDSKTRFIYAKRLMTGTAKLFLRTVTVGSWEELKRLLLREFRRTASSAEVHSEMRGRKKKREETLQQYLFVMQEIASKADMSEADIIHYVIGGIPDSNVNKMLLYAANSIEDLKQALRKYDRTKAHYNIAGTLSTENVKQQSSLSSGLKAVYPRGNSKKCFNCNEVGHVSTNCSKPRRQRGACFKCGKVGHVVQNCPSAAAVMAVSPSHRDEAASVTEEAVRSAQGEKVLLSANNNFVYDLRFDFIKESGRETSTCYLPALLDSGSAISLMQQQFVPRYVMTEVNPEEYQFCGIINSPLQVVGRTNCKVILFLFRFRSLHHQSFMGHVSVHSTKERSLILRIRRF